MDRPTKGTHMDGEEKLGSPLLVESWRQTVTSFDRLPTEQPEAITPTLGFLPITSSEIDLSSSPLHQAPTDRPAAFAQRSASLPPSISPSPSTSASDPLGLFVKRPVPSRQSFIAHPSSTNSNFNCTQYPIIRTPSLTSSSSFGGDLASPTGVSEGPSSLDALSPHLGSTSPIPIHQNLEQLLPPGPPLSQMSLLSQIIFSNGQLSKQLSSRTPTNSNPATALHSLHSTPISSNASSPVAQDYLRRVKSRRSSVGACEVLDEVGEEEGESLESAREFSDLHFSDVGAVSIKEEVPSNPQKPSSCAIRFAGPSVPSKRTPLPLSSFGPPVTILAPSSKQFDSGATTLTTPTPEFVDGSSPTTPVPAISDPSISSESSPHSPHSPLPNEIVFGPPKKPQLTFAVATTSARPAPPAKESEQLMSSLRDSDEDEDEEGQDDEDQDEEEDQDDNEYDEEEEDSEEPNEFAVEGDGYEEDDEGEGILSLEGAGAPVGRRYRFKRDSLFGQSDSEDDALGEEEEETGTCRLSRAGSVLSNFSGLVERDGEKTSPSLGLAFPISNTESSNPASQHDVTTGKHRRGPFLSFITSSQNRRSAHSPCRGGFLSRGGFSPGLNRKIGPVSSSPRGRVERDDFLPSHLKSEKGKERERMAERKEREMTTSGRSGAESASAIAGNGRCSRHRSPPPSGREGRKSGGERSEGGRIRPPKAPAPTPLSDLASTRPALLPPPPSPILRNPQERCIPPTHYQPITIGNRSASFSVPRRAPDGHLTPPVFFTDVENVPDDAEYQSKRRMSLTVVSSAFHQSTPLYVVSDDPSAAIRRNSYSLKVDVTQAVRQAKSDVLSDGTISDHPSDVPTALAQALHKKLVQQPTSPGPRPVPPPSTSFLKRHTSLLGTIAIAQPQQRLQPVPAVIPEMPSPEDHLFASRISAAAATPVPFSTTTTSPTRIERTPVFPSKRNLCPAPLVKSRPIPCPMKKVAGDRD